MRPRPNRIGRTVVVVVGLVVALAVGWFLFVVLPDTGAEVLGVLLTLVVAVLGLRAAGRLAERSFPSYNVAEVTVEGPITRDGGGLLPSMPGGVPADEVVEQIEAADERRGVDALLVTLNTPGGEILPSEDIRDAARSFDGPTVAHAQDVCASGGYFIATGCDEFWARELSIVGSIGVIGSTVNATELADRLGLSYERFAAGRYKDAGTPLREVTDDDREYLQGLVDGLYEDFVDRVVDGRDLEPDAVRETEARVYLGDEALELGLVDELGSREAVEERLEEQLGEPVVVRAFEPSRSLRQRLRGAAVEAAHAVGVGAAGALAGDRELDLELR